MNHHTLKRCLSALTSCLILAGSSAAMPLTGNAAANIISNSTFDSSTTGWGIYKESGGKGTLSTDNGRLALTVSSLGSVNYAVQMYYDIIPLYQNGVYRLSYEISCSTDRYIEAMIQQNGGTYQAYTWKGLNLTSEPQTVDYEFTMEAETDIMSKLVFNCGTQGDDLAEHTIYLDNVVLELVDDSNVDYSAFLPYEPDIMTNQVGYKPDSSKIAVFRDVTDETAFSVINADTGETALTGDLYGETVNSSADETDYFGDFSALTEPGTYYIECGNLDDSYTFEIADDVYGTLLDDSVKMLYLQRCGCTVEDDTFGHKACHTGLAQIYGTTDTIDVSGGWHDAGDYGRYIVPAAKAVADLLYAYDANPELYSDSIGIPESGNGVPDILDEVRYELEWMLKMQAESGGVYHKVTCANFPGYVMPENETAQLIVTPVSTTATADFCASMAMAYEFYSDTDTAFAETCLAAAEKAWAFLEANPDFIFENPEDITTGAYNDGSDYDERYWAAAQMYRATGGQTYLDYLNSNIVKTGLDWSTVGDYGNIALLTMDGIDTSSSVYTKAESSLVNRADKFVSATESSPYGVAISKFNWGSNMTIANAGVILGVAYDITGDEAYLNTAQDNLNYLLGKNPNGVCYVTGYGTVSPQNPHHRPSMAKGTAMKGMLVGGVNSNLEDSAAKAYLVNYPSAKCYIDHSESYSTNEITIYWNSPLTYLISLTEAENSSVQGDVNSDGSVNIADAVALQKYILNADTLKNLKAADLYEDNVIDVFDLIFMKKQIALNN
ncbi:MAG: glycoside hydrolase family 9 protein [Ruminococcus sp.]|nr:glycoside hydrolase family 9 protein [Ruminococcus sp.]